MRRLSLTSALLLLAFNCTAPAEDKPAPRKLHFLGVRAQKLEPNIDAVLLLTDEQRERLDKGHAEALHSPEMEELRKKAKDRSLPVEERKKIAAQLKEAISVAEVGWNTKRNNTLTADQATLINSINKIADAAYKAVNPDYAARLKTGTVEEKKSALAERDAKIKQIFDERLQKILNKEQKAALKKP